MKKLLLLSALITASNFLNSQILEREISNAVSSTGTNNTCATAENVTAGTGTTTISGNVFYNSSIATADVDYYVFPATTGNVTFELDLTIADPANQLNGLYSVAFDENNICGSITDPNQTGVPFFFTPGGVTLTAGQVLILQVAYGGDASQNQGVIRPYQITVTITQGALAPPPTVASPGGVSGADLWLKADDGATNAGSVLSGWTDQAGINTFTVNGSPGYLANSTNFKPSVSFDNSQPNTSLPGTYLAGNSPINYVDGFAVFTKTNANSGALIGSSAFSTYGAAIFSGESDNGMWVGNGANLTYQSFTNSAVSTGNLALVNLDVGPSSSPFMDARLNGSNQTVSSGTGSDFSSINLTPWIGGTNNNGVSFGWKHFRGEVAEIALYPSSLSAADKLKVESYLAIKYGITLDASVTNYVNSSGAAVWNNTTYWNDVFGIGKDDKSGLNSNQSNSMNTGSGDGTGQIGAGNIVISNPSSLDDGDYFMIGNNGDPLTELAVGSKLPPNLAGYTRLDRQWWAQELGDVGTINISFDLNGLTVSGTGTTDFRLIVDNDGDGDLSTGQPILYQADNFSGNVVSFNNINFSNNQAFALITEVVVAGGVANERMWLEASSGVSLVNGTKNVSNWADQIGENTFTVSGTPTYSTDEINFNPVVSFDNTDAKTVLPTNRIEGNQQITVREAFAVYKYDSTTNRGAALGSTVPNTNFGISVFAADNDQKAYVSNGLNNTNQSYDNLAIDTAYSINNLEWDTDVSPFSTGSLNGLAQTITAGSGGDFDSLNITPMIGGTNNAGNNAASGWFPFNGSLAEVIYFPDALSTTDRIKIQSYLAVKYGISLDPSVGNYLSANSTVIWDNTTYWNDVFGIGREDSEGLNQSRSNSINSGSGDGNGQLGKGNITISSSNLIDGQYLMIGHNNDSLGDILTDIPTSLQSSCRRRIAREWKAKNTNNVGGITLTFNLAGFNYSGIPSTQTADYGIMIDTDGDGDFTTGTVSSVVSDLYFTDFIAFTNLTIPDGAVFTFYLSVDNTDRDTLMVTSCGGYTWPNTGLTYTFSGFYNDTLINTFGCDSIVTLNLSQDNLTASVAITDSLACNGDTNGELTATASGGSSPYTYSWNNSGNTPVQGSLIAGTYTVTVQDNNGCVASDSIALNQPDSLNISINFKSEVNCNGGTDGNASVRASGGTNGGYAYAWSNSSVTTPFASGLSAGVFTVTVTDTNACTAIVSDTIKEPSLLVSSIANQNNVSCNGGSDGSIVLLTNGGNSGGYTFNWSNSPSNLAFAGSLSAGAFTVTVSDPKGCTTTVSGSITEPTTLSSSLAPTSILCFGDANGSISNTVTGGTSPYTYSWNDGPTTSSRTNLAAGTYTITVSDANGCTTTASTTVTQRPDLLVSLSPTNLVCNGANNGAISANASGGTSAYSYLWSNAATTATITGLAAGMYAVTVTDAFGCTELASTTLTQPTALVASISSSTNVDCNGNSTGDATAAASGGIAPYTFLWSNAATSATITSLAAGTYTVTVTDNNGCTNTASTSITQPTAVGVTISGQTNVDCNGNSTGTATAAGSGGTTPYTFAWSNASVTSTITALSAGTYTVTITDANGCTNSSSTVITEPTSLATTVVPTDISCNGLTDGSAVASSVGGTSPYTYNWSNAASTAAINNLSSGSYTVTTTDANGCTDIDVITISEPTLLVASSVVDSNITCNGLSDGGATASASGGTAPYTYNWSGQSSANILFAVGAGVYTVTVTDANSCTATSSVAITEPAALMVMTIVDSNATGFGIPDGGATANAMGGTSPYTYIWSNAATTSSVTGLVAGTYTVTVTDANSCSASNTVSITEPSSLSFSMSFIEPLCNGDANGSADVSQVSGGVSPYTFLWNTSATVPLVVNIGAGTYTVTVTDNNGNTAVDSVVVTEPAALSVSMLEANTSCANSLDGAGIALTTGGTSPYTYAWSNNQTTSSLSNVAVGTYTVIVTDNNGCTLLDSAVIASGDTIAPVAIAKDTTLYLDINGQLTVTGADIDNGSNDNCVISSLQVLNGVFGCSDLGANTVDLVAIDSDGNRDTTSAVVTVIDSIAPTIITQSYTVYLNANRRASFATTDIDNGTMDACGIDSLWADTSIVFNCSNAGANTVWLYAADVNGNLDSATATVNVIDSLSKDSVVTIALGCGSYTWAQNGQTYSATGIYNDTLLNPLGCDSIYYVLELGIDNPTNEIDTVSACNSYSWRDGNEYTSNNSTATFAIQNTNGCDSIVYTLNLTINSTDSLVTFQDSACNSYTWTENNQTYTSSGIYTNVLTNANGCDSTITLNLEIRPLSLSVINMSDSLFAFENHPQATYQWFDCRGDSIIPGATNKGYKPDTTGFYSVIVTNGLCSDTSNCQEVISIGLNERALKATQMNIYPNPTSEDFFFEIDQLEDNQQLIVFDMKGKLIVQREIDQLKTKIETEGWNAGIYFIRYKDQMKKIVITR